MARSERLLSGKVAVVTGGARGIGRAIASALVSDGVRVGIGDIDSALAIETARGLGAAARGYALDVTDIASYEEFLDAVAVDLGPIDIVVNNAGIMPLGAFAAESTESTSRQIAINVNGVVNGCRLAIPRLSGRNGAHIVNIASAAGRAGYPGVATYCGTKHFVLGFSEGLRLELAPLGVELSCVLPSVVNTDLSKGMGQVPGFKTIEPEDVAAVVVATLKRPKFEVFVPRSLLALTRLTGLLPRVVQDAAIRWTGTDKATLQPDWTARAAYERRAIGTAGEQAGEEAAERSSAAVS